MGRRPLLAMALGWFLVVVAVAAVTFVVVDRAGRGVGQASAARTVAALPTAPPAPSVTPPPSPARPTPTRTATPRPTKATTSVPRPTTRSTTRTAPKPVSTPTVRPAEPRTVSFTTQGGTVVATCAGAVLTLESITPRDGWRFEQESDSEGLEVKFKPGAEDVDEVEIAIACVRGVPTRLAS